MNKLSWLIALGVGAFIAFAVATLPASVLLGQLEPYGVSAAGVDGTAWKGRAQALRVHGAHVGAVEWDLHALALLALKLQADVKLSRPEGFAQTQIALRFNGPVAFENLTASLPLSALSGVAPPGWNGTVNLQFAELTLLDGWPVEAHGTADLIDIASAAQRSPISGSYRVAFPATGSGAPEEATQDVPQDALIGAVSDLGGPLQIAGTLQLNPDRSYLLKGRLAARPDAPRDLVNQLQILGPADSQGRREFALDGTM